VHRILDAWGLKKGEAAYIGDSQVDRITARMAGVRFWSYGDPGLQADLHIPDFWRLRQCFRMARNRPRTASSG
jgi:FMN phosphatase YigB (HAD superfamily)